MKITLNELRGMQMGLQVILGKELPVKTAYWLTRFFDKVGSEMKAMEKTRMMLVKKYAKKDKDGNPLVIKDKDGKQTNQYDLGNKGLEDFNKEYEILAKEEVKIDFKPIKLEALGDIKLKPIVLIQLGKIIEE